MAGKALCNQLIGRARQRGFGTLILALVILTGLTSVVFYAAQTGLNRQRIVANEIRTREALEAAEAGVERAMTYLEENRTLIASSDSGGWVANGNWLSCSNASTTLPCSTIKDQIDATGSPLAALSTLGNKIADYVAYRSSSTSVDPTMLRSDSDGVSGPVSKPRSAFASLGLATGQAPAEVYVAAVCADDDANNVCDGTAPKLGSGSAFLIVSTGYSADQSGQATVQQGVSLIPAVGAAPDAPLVASSTIDLGGSIELVTNPNGGGPGVPLSVWSSENVTIGSSAVTCQLGEYLESGNPTLDGDSGIYTCPATGGDKCTCSSANATGQLSYNDPSGLGVADGGDITDNATTFPNDLFAYVFGVSRDNYTEIKDKAQVVADCSGLGPSSSGIIWVTGACHVTANTTVGSIANPVLLVVEDQALQLNSNTTIFGLVFIFDANDDQMGADMSINGTAQVYGAVVAEAADLTNGTLILRYEKKVLTNLSASDQNKSVARIAGTWRDDDT